VDTVGVSCSLWTPFWGSAPLTIGCPPNRGKSNADVLLLELRDESPIDAVEEHGGIVISYGDKGLSVSVEFLNPS